MQSKLLTMAAATFLAVGLSAQGRLLHTVGAPVPGSSFKIRLTNPATSAGNGYVLVASGHTDQTSTFPPGTGIVGTFRLHPTLFLILQFGTLAATPTDIASAIPNDTNLLGVQADLQYADNTGTSTILSDNELVLTVIANAGTTLTSLGGTGDKVGMVFRQIKQATVGEPKLLKDVYGHAHRWDTGRVEG